MNNTIKTLRDALEECVASLEHQGLFNGVDVSGPVGKARAALAIKDAPALEAVPVLPGSCQWPLSGKFRVLKEGEIGDHTPWQLVCPSGEVLELNHHADDTVDEARAKWMGAVLNLATEDWSPFLKEDETPLQRLNRERADCDTLATLLADARRSITAPAKQEDAPLAAPEEWQPMETAPRDGTYILLGNRCGAWIGRYKSEYTSGWKPANPWQCMMLNTEHLTKPGSIVPNYWMPLTAAPLATKQSPAAPTNAKEST